MITLKRLAGEKYLIFAILLYLSLVLPFIGSIPYLDGNIDFVKSYDFYSGGLTKLLANWKSIHPPLKEITAAVFFKILGVSAYSYNIIGIPFGLTGIFFFNKLLTNLYGERVSQVATILLATSPLFISVGFYALTDFILTSLLIISLYSYAKEKYLYFGIFASLAFFTKETALIFVISVVFTEILFLFKKILSGEKLVLKISKTILFILPFFTSFLWYSYLSSEGKSLWSDWNFSKVSERGTFYTIIHNLLTLNFINKYALQNLLQLLFLNFNWILFLILLIGIVVFLINKKGLTFVKLLKDEKKTKILLMNVAFCLSYILTVLTFQTYTIPRYALPLMPFLYIGVSWSLKEIHLKMGLSSTYLNVFLFLVVFLGLFFSLDPIPSKLWGKMTVFGEEVYALNRHLAASDGITYNLQYLSIVKKRTELLLESEDDVETYKNSCLWIYPDPRNDYKTSIILSLPYKLNYKCS